MAITQAYYAQCDKCGQALETGFPEPLLFDSPSEARDGALEHGFLEAEGQLLCGVVCLEQAEVDTERDVAETAVVDLGDVAELLPDFLLEVYGEVNAAHIANSEAWRALVYRVAERLATGEELKTMFDELAADDIACAPEAIDPAAFRAARIRG